VAPILAKHAILKPNLPGKESGLMMMAMVLIGRKGQVHNDGDFSIDRFNNQ